MDSPKISILIPVYNGQETIDQCLESVRRQTYRNFEIICVNDASFDKTLNKLKEWQEIFGLNKFILINNVKNLGVTKSLNLALSRAQGKYIARIDADDTWLSEKLEKQIDFMETHPEYGIVGCNYTNISKHNLFARKICTYETDEEMKKKIFRRNPFAHSCILAKKEIIEKAGNYDKSVRYGQDYDLWLRCLPLTRFYNLQEFLCERLVDNGISIRKQNAQMVQCIKTQLKYIKLYGYPKKNYIYLLEPLSVILIPATLKKLIRRYS